MKVHIFRRSVRTSQVRVRHVVIDCMRLKVRGSDDLQLHNIHTTFYGSLLTESHKPFFPEKELRNVFDVRTFRRKSA
jgi:hypothetical protein